MDAKQLVDYLEKQWNWQIIARWQFVALQTIHTFTLEELTRSIYALHETDYPLSNDFIRYWEIYIIGKISMCTPQQLSRIMSVIYDIIDRLEHKAEILRKLEAVSIKLLPNMTINEAIKNINTFADMNRWPSTNYAWAFKQTLLSSQYVQDLSAENLITLMTTIQRIKQLDPPKKPTVGGETRPILKSLDGRALVENVLVSNVDVIRHIENLITELEPKCQIRDFSPIQVALYMNVYRDLLIKPADKILKIVEDHVIKTIHEFQLKECINSMYSLASLGVNPLTLLNVLLLQVLETFSKINTSQLALVIYAMALVFINMKQNGEFCTIEKMKPAVFYMIKQMKKKINMGVVASFDRCIVDRGVRIIELINGDKLDWIYILPEDGYCTQKHDIMSRFEQEVWSILTQSNQETGLWEKEIWSVYSLSHIDFLSHKYKVIIEADGTHHFIASEGEHMYRRPQDYANEIMWKAEYPSYKIVRIPYFDWQPMNFIQRKEYIKKLIQPNSMYPTSSHALESSRTGLNVNAPSFIP